MNDAKFERITLEVTGCKRVRRQPELTIRCDSVLLIGVKSLALILAVLSISLASCSTLANRKDLFSPAKGEGPYTEMQRDMNRLQSKKVSKDYLKQSPVAGRKHKWPPLKK